MFKNFPNVIQATDLRNNANNKTKSTPCQMIVRTTGSQWPDQNKQTTEGGKRQIVFKVTKVKLASVLIIGTTYISQKTMK